MRRAFYHQMEAHTRPELHGLQSPALNAKDGNVAWHTMQREDYLLRARREEYLAGETEVDAEFFKEVLQLAGDKPEYAEMRECALGFLAAMQLVQHQNTPEMPTPLVADSATLEAQTAPLPGLRVAS